MTKFTLKFLTVLLLLKATLGQADPLLCGVPLDTVVLGAHDRQSLRLLFSNTQSAGESPLADFWQTWNETSLQRASRSLLGIQDITFKQLLPYPAIETALALDSASAIAKVASGTWQFAWVRGDKLQNSGAKVTPVVVGRTYFDAEDQESFVLVARVDRKFSSLGLLDTAGLQRAATLIKRGGLHLGYGGVPEEAMDVLRAVRLDPFGPDSLVGPNYYVHRYFNGEQGVDQLIAGKDSLPGVDLAALDPGYWKYIVSNTPGRSQMVTPVWQTADFVLLARVGEVTKDGLPLYLKHARLGIYLDKGLPAFTTAISATEIGKRALANQVIPPHEDKLDDGESALDALWSGLDVVFVQKRGLDVYRSLKSGAGNALEVIGTLPPLLPPVLIANPNQVSAEMISLIQTTLLQYHWRTTKMVAGRLMLLRGFSRFSLPEGVQP